MCPWLLAAADRADQSSCVEQGHKGNQTQDNWVKKLQPLMVTSSNSALPTPTQPQRLSTEERERRTDNGAR